VFADLNQLDTGAHGSSDQFERLLFASVIARNQTDEGKGHGLGRTAVVRAAP
jgi:hypothetical protein